MSKRTVLYVITSFGRERLLELKISYYKAIQNLYQVTQDDVVSFFSELNMRNISKVFCYGAGDVAQTILLITYNMKNKPVEILGIIDDDPYKQSTTISGFNVYSYECLTKMKHDGIVILATSSKTQIWDRLDKIKYPKERTFSYFD